VSQLGGRIHVDSRLGRGTTFALCFPRTLEAAAVNPAPAPAPSADERGSETILVVEDEPMVRAITVRSLRGRGYRVVVASNGAEALAVGAEELARVELLVTDMVMPGIDGRSVAEALRQRRPGLRVLFVSGYSPEAVSERGLLEPGFQLLEKPFTPADLLARVRAVLDGR
jgi:CheY-like chemotaxis protein